ncbi:MAG: phage major capsid protein [Armatimonadetes bacterium JP3_11]|nr:MAG: phage major capsid protein [Armatimonadetes bacterium JP3_11]
MCCAYTTDGGDSMNTTVYTETLEKYTHVLNEARALIQVCEDSEGKFRGTEAQFERLVALRKEAEDLKAQLDKLANENLPALKEAIEGLPDPAAYAPPSSPPAEAKTLGQLVARDMKRLGKAPEAFWAKNYDLDLQLKATLTRTDYPPEALRTGVVVPFPVRQLTLLDIVNIVPTQLGSIRYMEQTTHTPAAAETAEGSALPESTFAFTERNQPVQAVGAYLPVTEEALEDNDGLQAIVDGILLYAVRERVETQMIQGNGTAPNLLGVINTPGVQTFARSTTPRIDALLDAIGRVAGSGATTGNANADAIILNWADYIELVTEKDATGRYLFGDPVSALGTSVMGVPVIPSNAMPANTALVGAFRQWHILYQRRGVQVEVGLIGNNFVQRVRTLRCYGRFANVVLRPRAFCTITGF